MQARIKTFDWLKAARIIRDRKVQNASAGLAGDESMTSGLIVSDGKIAREGGAYLSSTWATPVLRIHHNNDADGEFTETMIFCWRYADEITDSLRSHDWPDEAVAIAESDASNQTTTKPLTASARLERIEQAARIFLAAKDRVLMPYDSEARSAINALISAIDGDEHLNRVDPKETTP